MIAMSVSDTSMIAMSVNAMSVNAMNKSATSEIAMSTIVTTMITAMSTSDMNSMVEVDTGRDMDMRIFWSTGWLGGRPIRATKH